MLLSFSIYDFNLGLNCNSTIPLPFSYSALLTDIKYEVVNSEIYNVQGDFEGKFYINVEDDVTKISHLEYTKLAKSIYKRTNYKNIKGYNTLKTKNKNKPKKILIYVYEYKYLFKPS